MVADSNTDSQLSHGSPISGAFFQLKIDDARRRQCVYQWKRANVVGEEDSGCSRLRSLRAWSIDYDSDSSPRSVLKNKDSDDDDCFCCSKQVIEEEEEAFVDEEDPSAATTAKLVLTEERCKQEPSLETKPDEKKKEEDDCPLCTLKLDETDLRFKLCPCGYKMCLFCYKKIDEDTRRCPGCRNKYEETSSSNSGEVSFQQRGAGPIPLSSSFQGLDKA